MLGCYLWIKTALFLFSQFRYSLISFVASLLWLQHWVQWEWMCCAFKDYLQSEFSRFRMCSYEVGGSSLHSSIWWVFFLFFFLEQMWDFVLAFSVPYINDLLKKIDIIHLSFCLFLYLRHSLARYSRLALTLKISCSSLQCWDYRYASSCLAGCYTVCLDF